jgi:predicted phosphoadenosine phosphosulfate sulfurtransferase
VRQDLSVTVEEALNQRLDALSNRNLLYIAFSGGKDSLVLLHAVWSKIKAGVIDPNKVVIYFVDEEAIFPCIESTVMFWRKRMLDCGCSFLWLCLEWRHYNCFSSLAEEESWICWDRREKAKWVRPMPAFAIKSHPLFQLGMSYQDFFNKMVNDGTQVIGIRLAESVQRAQFLLRTGVTNDAKSFPIYDFRDTDVWLYLLKHKIQIPECYLHMWKAGTSKRMLRVSQFFSIDTAHHLVHMVEYYPGLYERILIRDPNARLAMHYFDSEMFRRSTATRRKLEADKIDVNWRKKLFEAMSDPAAPIKDYALHKTINHIILKYSANLTPKLYKRLYSAVIAGDPKKRTVRAVQSIAGIPTNKDIKKKRCTTI